MAMWYPIFSLRNLQAKATIAFLLAAIVPLIAISLLAIQAGEAAIQAIVLNQLENVAAEKQELLERWLDERRADLRVVAGALEITQLDPSEMRAYLDLVGRQYGVYDHFVVSDIRGQVLCDTSDRGPRSVADEIWFREAAAGENYLSPVVRPAPGAEPVFRLSTTIGPSGDHPRGVVCATVQTSSILRRVLRLSLGRTGESYLVDREGTFLAHQDPGRVLASTIAPSGSFQRLFERGGAPSYLDYRNIPVLGASRPIHGTPWHVVVEQDWDEAFLELYELRAALFWAIGLTLATVIGIAVLSGFYVTAPIRRLSRAANAVAYGDYDSPLVTDPPKRKDEIGLLHADFARMAAQLKQRHSQLESRVGLTEAELRRTDVRLRHTLEAAARSEHLAAMGRLASGVAHEIRTPLTSLKLYLQSLAGTFRRSTEEGEDFEIAMQQVVRIETTINHFLDFARPRKPILTRLDPLRLIDGALRVVRPRARQQQVEVELDAEAGLPVVPGDERQLSDALLNLFVNALEAMPYGGRLTIGVRSSSPIQPKSDEQAPASSAGEANPTDEPAQLSAVVIEVSDTGGGIAPGDLAHLFEPFFTTKATGSGLGLAIARGTVELHGGELRVQNCNGSGAVFTISLPTQPPGPEVNGAGNHNE